MDLERKMPDLPTLAGTFRNAGYQAFAVGKLHVFPQRDRIGFDDVLLSEERRIQWGVIDDYDAHLAEAGFPGRQFAHGMGNNQYLWRPWHLPEELHVSSWATREMARIIRRRDPTRPAFWYLSYTHPHPPLTPLRDYMDLYERDDVDDDLIEGEWSSEPASIPYAAVAQTAKAKPLFASVNAIRNTRLAFYALSTQIDHQLRVVIGTLREEGILDNTIILFTSDHGTMLGDHRLWGTGTFYEDSARIAMILLGTSDDDRINPGHVDDRLVGLQDVMPSLLDLAGIDAPKGMEGLSMIGTTRRDYLYGELNDGPLATRMVTDGRYKLIYYAVGNSVQLFDLLEDPDERRDLATASQHRGTMERLCHQLIQNLYGQDESWLSKGELTGLPDREIDSPDRGLYGQRGIL